MPASRAAATSSAHPIPQSAVSRSPVPREANLRTRLEEHAPAGLDAGLIHAS